MGTDPAKRGWCGAAAEAFRGILQQRGTECEEDLSETLRHRHRQHEYGLTWGEGRHLTAEPRDFGPAVQMPRPPNSDVGGTQPLPGQSVEK